MRKRPQSRPTQPAGEPSKGLFRTELAGPGRTLNEAFPNLERASAMERICRHSGRDLFGGRLHLTGDEGNGHWHFTRIRNEMYVIVGDFIYKDPRVENLSGDDLIQLYFKLSGDLTLAVSLTEPLQLSQPGLLIYHQPHGVDVQEWTAPSSHERFVCINITPRCLMDLFAAQPPEPIPAPLEALINKDTASVHYSQLPLSAEMFELATKLVDNPYDGVIGLLYTEALTMELVCQVIGNFAQISATPHAQYSPREVRCLHAARRLLMKELSKPPTIPQVAHAAGINETTLKRGFKALFGETIFDFSVRCRMQHALTLLREQRISMTEVGEAVGYRHQTSFATAFRRHFGMRPKDVRTGRQL
jgi:AraC-like DNA-binding protein